MKDAIQRVEPNSTATVDTREEILTAKEVAQDIEASRSWVYAHADELGGYRAPQKKWGAKNPSENKDRRSANETRAIPFPFGSHRAESIP